jgi:hypothetical protein
MHPPPVHSLQQGQALGRLLFLLQSPRLGPGFSGSQLLMGLKPSKSRHPAHFPGIVSKGYTQLDPRGINA